MAQDLQSVDREESGPLFWIEKEIVPKIAKALGKDARNSKCEIKVPTNCFFISTVYEMELSFCCKGETESEKIRAVVKVPPVDTSTRAFVRSDILFHSEIIFYQSFGKNYSEYPKCLLIIPEPLSRAVIVMEHVMQFGYKALESQEDLEMKHVFAAVREIGKFHARGYVLKEKYPEEFFRVAMAVRESQFDHFAHPVRIKVTNTISLRPVNYLRSINYDSVFCDKISIFFSDAHEKVLKDCITPRNELATLCHGDFTLNNVHFREEVDGEFKAMLIDFAQFRYASPATDISLFVHLSCEEKIRKNFPVIFRVYHDAVLEYLEEQGVQDLEKYTFDSFLKDYKRHAVFGCENAIFFMPVLCLQGQRVNYNDVIKNPTNYIESLLVSGGDELSRRLVDMLLELKDNGCLDHMIYRADSNSIS